MKDKILALLMAKFSGVRKDGLTHIAAILACQAADDTEAQALVEKITTEQVTEIIKNYRTEVDREVGAGTKTHEENLKKKYDLVEKKQPDPTNPTPKEGDDAPAYVKTLLEGIEALTKKVAAIETEKSTTTRRQAIEAKLTGVSEKYKESILKQFGRMSFESDDDFTSYLGEVEADAKDFAQEEANNGLSALGKPRVPAGGASGKEASKEELDKVMENINI